MSCKQNGVKVYINILVLPLCLFCRASVSERLRESLQYIWCQQLCHKILAYGFLICDAKAWLKSVDGRRESRAAPPFL